LIITQHNNTRYCYAECRKSAHYAECHHAEIFSFQTFFVCFSLCSPPVSVLLKHLRIKVQEKFSVSVSLSLSQCQKETERDSLMAMFDLGADVSKKLVWIKKDIFLSSISNFSFVTKEIQV
jgi:hypothetical protein